MVPKQWFNAKSLFCYHPHRSFNKFSEYYRDEVKWCNTWVDIRSFKEAGWYRITSTTEWISIIRKWGRNGCFCPRREIAIVIGANLYGRQASWMALCWKFLIGETEWTNGRNGGRMDGCRAPGHGDKGRFLFLPCYLGGNLRRLVRFLRQSKIMTCIWRTGGACYWNNTGWIQREMEHVWAREE